MLGQTKAKRGEVPVADGRLGAKLGLEPRPPGSHLHLPSLHLILMTITTPPSNPNIQCAPVLSNWPK